MRKTWWAAGAFAALGVAAAVHRLAPQEPQGPGQVPLAAGPASGAGAAARAAGAPGAWFGDVAAGGGGGPSGGTVVESPERQAAFMAVLNEPPSEARAARLRAAFVAWLLDAPEHALAHSARVPGEERRQIMTEAFVALALRHPAVFERHAGSLAPHGTDLAAVLGAIAEQDPGRALDWVNRHPAYDKNGQLGAAVLPALMRSDPASAARAVAAMKARAPLALIQQVATAYARHDPAQAYAWVRQLAVDRTDVTPARLLDDVSASLVAGDPQAAEEFMSRTAEPDVRASLLNGLALRKGQDDLDAAWDWLQRYGTDAAYADAAQNLLYRWSYARPQEVARILPQVADADLQARAAAHLAQLWQRRDAVGYQAWLASLPPGTLRTALAAR